MLDEEILEWLQSASSSEIVKAKMTQPATFTMFRRGDISDTHDKNQRPTSPDAPAFWGVVWPDGTCVLRWCGVVGSTSLWDSFEDAMKIHGHFDPEDNHDPLLVWDDPNSPHPEVDAKAMAASAADDES